MRSVWWIPAPKRRRPATEARINLEAGNESVEGPWNVREERRRRQRRQGSDRKHEEIQDTRMNPQGLATSDDGTMGATGKKKKKKKHMQILPNVLQDDFLLMPAKKPTYKWVFCSSD